MSRSIMASAMFLSANVPYHMLTGSCAEIAIAGRYQAAALKHSVLEQRLLSRRLASGVMTRFPSDMVSPTVSKKSKAQKFRRYDVKLSIVISLHFLIA